MMYSMDGIDFEAIMSRHLFADHQTNASTTSSTTSSTDFFLYNDTSSDSDLYSPYNSDQENTEDKL